MFPKLTPYQPVTCLLNKSRTSWGALLQRKLYLVLLYPVKKKLMPIETCLILIKHAQV